MNLPEVGEIWHRLGTSAVKPEPEWEKIIIKSVNISQTPSAFVGTVYFVSMAGSLSYRSINWLRSYYGKGDS